LQCFIFTDILTIIPIMTPSFQRLPEKVFLVIIVSLLCISAFSQEVIQGTWATQADGYRGKNGQRVTYTFPAGGTLSSRIWGTDLYTDDSSIATAAVHAGLITPQNGGTVTIEIRSGASTYQGTNRNGVNSQNYGSWSGSFVFVSGGATNTTQIVPSNAIQGSWSTQADSYRGKTGQRYTFTFPGGGTLSSRLWGADLYTDDSSIATAAVHAGLITAQNGGIVTIEIRPGASSYQGTSRNGVTSQGYGPYSGSFVFVSGGSTAATTVVTTVTPVNGLQGNWATQADSYRGKTGQRYTFTFPGGGTISNRVWGTDLYTDDSSIAAAAVHAGMITAQNGGTVTIEIREGAPSYKGSSRNGVNSQNYGSWSGSFVFVSGSTTGTAQVIPANTLPGNWATQADTYRGKNGQRYTFSFPGGGTLSSRVWGTDLYTDDSSIASAAVHAGLISVQNGGTVTIEIRAGAPGYLGSTRNGVTSQGYGSWQGSFVFVRP
jgi:hypothetical protein